MTPSEAGKGIDHREIKSKFDPRWDEYETHNKERLRKLRESFRKKGGKR